jgi:diguanylate cyclase (GGDEF)-like protein
LQLARESTLLMPERIPEPTPGRFVEAELRRRAGEPQEIPEQVYTGEETGYQRNPADRNRDRSGDLFHVESKNLVPDRDPDADPLTPLGRKMWEGTKSFFRGNRTDYGGEEFDPDRYRAEPGSPDFSGVPRGPGSREPTVSEPTELDRFGEQWDEFAAENLDKSGRPGLLDDFRANQVEIAEMGELEQPLGEVASYTPDMVDPRLRQAQEAGAAVAAENHSMMQDEFEKVWRPYLEQSGKTREELIQESIQNHNPAFFRGVNAGLGLGHLDYDEWAETSAMGVEQGPGFLGGAAYIAGYLIGSLPLAMATGGLVGVGAMGLIRGTEMLGPKLAANYFSKRGAEGIGARLWAANAKVNLAGKMMLATPQAGAYAPSSLLAGQHAVRAVPFMGAAELMREHEDGENRALSMAINMTLGVGASAIIGPGLAWIFRKPGARPSSFDFGRPPNSPFAGKTEIVQPMGTGRQVRAPAGAEPAPGPVPPPAPGRTVPGGRAPIPEPTAPTRTAQTRPVPPEEVPGYVPEQVHPSPRVPQPVPRPVQQQHQTPPTIGPEVPGRTAEVPPAAAPPTLLEEFPGLKSLPKRKREEMEMMFEGWRDKSHSDLFVSAVRVGTELKLSPKELFEAQQALQVIMAESGSRPESKGGVSIPEPTGGPPPAAETSTLQVLGTEAGLDPADVAGVEASIDALSGPPAPPASAEPVERRAPSERTSRRERVMDAARMGERTGEFTDQATGLANRNAWEAAQSRVDADPDSYVLVTDVRGLKSVNDAEGHPAGDALLQRVADELRTLAEERGIDTRNVFRPGLMRYGGDEFITVASSAEEAEEIGSLLKEVIGETPIEGTEFITGIRYGVGSTFQEADDAMGVAHAAETGATERPRPGTPPGDEAEQALHIERSNIIRQLASTRQSTPIEREALLSRKSEIDAELHQDSPDDAFDNLHSDLRNAMAVERTEGLAKNNEPAIERAYERSKEIRAELRALPGWYGEHSPPERLTYDDDARRTRRLAAGQRAITKANQTFSEETGLLEEVTARPAELDETPEQRLDRMEAGRDESDVAAVQSFEEDWRQIRIMRDRLPAEVAEELRLEWNSKLDNATLGWLKGRIRGELEERGLDTSTEAGVAVVDEFTGETDVIAGPADPEVLHQVTGPEGTEARVVELEDGRFSVTLRDTDAGETVPTVQIFDSKADAIAYADTISEPTEGGLDAMTAVTSPADIQVVLGNTSSGVIIEETLKPNSWGRMEIAASPRFPRRNPDDPYDTIGIEGSGYPGEQTDVVFKGRALQPYDGEPWALDTGAYAEKIRSGGPELDARTELGYGGPEEDFFDQWLMRVNELAAGPEEARPFMAVLPDVPVLPGKPGTAAQSIAVTTRWLQEAPEGIPYYVPVQDGMVAADVALLAKNPKVAGIFLGGSTEFKVAEGQAWSDLAHDAGLKFHYARAGTPKLLRHAISVGADSMDSAFPLWTKERLAEFVRVWQNPNEINPGQTELLLTDAESIRVDPQIEGGTSIGGSEVDPRLARMAEADPNMASIIARDDYNLVLEDIDYLPEGVRVTMNPRAIEGEVVEYEAGSPGSTTNKPHFYDPRLADVGPNKNGYVEAKPKPDTGLTSLPNDKTEGILYRGMSALEYEAIQSTGQIESRGDFNIGEEQKGTTSFGLTPATAESYASGIASWHEKPTFESPGYVIAVRRPTDASRFSNAPGTDAGSEVSVSGSIPASEIVTVWRGDVFDFEPGTIQFSTDLGSGFHSGSRSSSSPRLVWNEVDAPGQEVAPWVGASPEDDMRWFGSSVEVSALGVASPAYSGRVVRVLNGGDLLEITADGDAFPTDTFRVAAERVTITELRDDATDVVQEPTRAVSTAEPKTPAPSGQARLDPDTGEPLVAMGYELDEAGAPIRQQIPLEGPQGLAQASQKVDMGEPLAGHDGRATEVLFANGQRLKAVYRVVSDVRQINNSHDFLTMTPREGFPELLQNRQRDAAGQRKMALEAFTGMVTGFDERTALDLGESVNTGPPTLVGAVSEAGNMRSDALKVLFEKYPEAWQRYQGQLATTAEQLGIDPASFANDPAPGLIRQVIDDSVDLTDRTVLSELNAQSDVAPGASKDLLSAATTRARRLEGSARGSGTALTHLRTTIEPFVDKENPGQTLREYLRSADGKEFVNKLVADGVIDSGEISRFRSDSGKVHAAGADMISEMIEAAAIGDARLAATADQEIRSILNDLEHAYPSIVGAAGNPKYDLRGSLQGALEKFIELRGQDPASGIKTLAQMAQQGSMMDVLAPAAEDKQATTLALFIEASNRAQIKEAFGKYDSEARIALAEADYEGGGSLFGADLTKTPAQAFKDSFGGPQKAALDKRKPC